MPTLSKLYSMQEASEHNTKDDCWVVIDGKIASANGYRICKPSPSLSDRQCCGFGGLLYFSLSIRSVAWFCSVEIGDTQKKYLRLRS
ncbi:cytochrome b5 isoform a [Quercus suber]|uniref:Cytochrome b5 isoform a n=1 Tax=Quercus suber TaxID=58331 RepID=A0AAW0LL86_QUESU